jgi:hypothetical protein
MREETASWLNPMLEAINAGHVPDGFDIDIKALMWEASIPAVEAADPLLDYMAKLTADTPTDTRAVDWIRLGQLLRRQLGWDHYPAYPAYPEEEP